MDFIVIDDDKTFRDATCFIIEESGHYAEGVGSAGSDWSRSRKTSGMRSCWTLIWEPKTAWTCWRNCSGNAPKFPS